MIAQSVLYTLSNNHNAIVHKFPYTQLVVESFLFMQDVPCFICSGVFKIYDLKCAPIPC